SLPNANFAGEIYLWCTLAVRRKMQATDKKMLILSIYTCIL
ncbi:unnamed protein product, partial [marine sediment metagenome]